MHTGIPEGPISPPPGRPSWDSGGKLPLLYLGWGRRDFKRDPLIVHYDRGTDYHVLLRGEVVVTTGKTQHVVRGPAAMIFNPNFAFGITQIKRQPTEILVWIWQGMPDVKELKPPANSFLALDLRPPSIESLIDLHIRSRKEVAQADIHLPKTLSALRTLVEVELVRGSRATASTSDMRWDLATSWMKNNIAINAPVPALCDYLGMSPSTLHRFFRAQINQSPGSYFRGLKVREAIRLIKVEGWQVKAAAYHLGYKHPNDLSRTLAVWTKSQI